MAVGETFAFFLDGDPLTTALPVPALANDRLPVVRGGLTYYTSALALIGGVPVLQRATPASGETVAMEPAARALYIGSAALAALTVLLPADVGDSELAEICFAAPVTALTVLDAASAAVPTAPTSGYGPGAAIQFRFINPGPGWVLWK
jgi:hypothetical protein